MVPTGGVKIRGNNTHWLKHGSYCMLQALRFCTSAVQAQHPLVRTGTRRMARLVRALVPDGHRNANDDAQLSLCA